MANKKIFHFIVFLVIMKSISIEPLQINFMQPEFEQTFICPDSPCRSFSPEQIIIGLWSLVGSLSPLLTEFKNTIISLLHVSSERELALLLAETLWTVDKFTGFNPENASTITVYDSLINQIIAASNGGDMKDLHAAIHAYGKLCQSAIEYSIHVGLQAAGCPSEYLHTKKTVLTPPLCRTDCIKLLFEILYSEIPEQLQDIILQLSQSSNIIDQTVAVGCIAAATPSSIDLFEALLQRDELLEVLQLKACNLRIPQECCIEREIELKSQCKQLSEATIKTIATLTSTTNNISCGCRLQTITTLHDDTNEEE